ncbi:hypothetical protein JCM10450v2_006022 [Rhodotorula kratochvilovae]
MDRQSAHRISISDAAKALFPRTSLSRPLLAAHRPLLPVGPRPPAVAATPSLSHHQFFSFELANRLARGIEVRRRILDVLDKEGVLHELENLADLATVLVAAQKQAKKEDTAVYISTGLVAAPNFEKEYKRNGWAKPGVKFANFRPALLKVTYAPKLCRVGRGKTRISRQWDVQVVNIKSTHPKAIIKEQTYLERQRLVPEEQDKATPLHQLYPADEFKLLVYRYFLAKLVEELQDDEDADPLVDRLKVKNKAALWRYTGCFAHGCTDEACILNKRDLSSGEIEEQCGRKISNNEEWVREILFERIPRELGNPKAVKSAKKKEREVVQVYSGHAVVTFGR